MPSEAQQGSANTTPKNPREAAVARLIESLQTRYPQRGFFLHPSLRFCLFDEASKRSGMRVVAGKAIEKGQNLVVIPRDSTLNSSQAHTPKELRSLYQKLRNRFRSEASKYEVPPEEFKDAWLAIRIMHVLSAKNNASRSRGDSTATDPFWYQCNTWPSEDELDDSYFGFWNEKQVEAFWGYQSALTLEWVDRRKKLDYIFENILYPTLQQEANGGSDFIDASLPSNIELSKSSPSSKKALLRNTFLYAHGLVYTRAHGMSGVNGDGDGEECQILPLVELFNGDVSGASVDTSTSVNVALVGGKWPFLGGGVYRNDCNLACSCVYALRELEAGEELIISYGHDVPANHFMMKYGALPMSLLDPTRTRCNIRLWCDPTFIPTDRKRIACLETNGGFPVEGLKHDRDCSLTDIVAYGEEGVYNGYTALELYRDQGCELEEVGSMRQFLILAVLADEEELDRNLRTGRLRGQLYAPRVFPLLCRIVDYNLGLLQGPKNATTSADDVRAAQTSPSSWEASALLARVAYRETLLAWRHVFLERAMEFSSGPSDEELLYEFAHPCIPNKTSGCGVCGRTYPSLKCGRCKVAKYCSRKHQKADWKYHKGICGSR